MSMNANKTVACIVNTAKLPRSNHGKQTLHSTSYVGVTHPMEGLKENEYGTETEAEKHMKLLLQKQLKTDMTLAEHLAQHRQFENSSTYTSMTELLQGTCSLQRYKEVEESEERRRELQQSGLTEEEIRLHMTQSSTAVPNDKKKNLLEPSAMSSKLLRVQEKIESHKTKLQSSETFSGTKVLSRHSMDIEKSLYVGCTQKKRLDYLISEMPQADLRDSDPFKHIKDLSEKLAWSKRKRRKVTKKTEDYTHNNPLEDATDKGEFTYDPSIHHVIVPLDDIEVTNGRLTFEEIKKMPRFENYTPGIPSNVLYLKNLHAKVTVRELQALFGSFQTEGGDCINYKVLSGRMKGQAFVSFPDVEMAVKALQHANGFMLRHRPIIIEYGRKG